jgi:hypothetical protein
MKRVFAIDVELCERCGGADHRLHLARAGPEGAALFD